MRDERHDEPLSSDELELFLQFLHRFPGTTLTGSLSWSSATPPTRAS
ncbi:hypothetical protein [Streptomyces sp. V1I1]|nr:hypothetical protein [Streptomyces sp. V1I1]MDQ0941937.1 hypothetical protein [Streptomyces sp. V1I1]